MKKRTRISFVFLALAVISVVVNNQLSSNDNKRDVIIFPTPIETVIDSLVVMNNFINNMSVHLDKNSGYRIDKGKFYNDLYIGGEKIANLDEVRKTIENSKHTTESVQINFKANDVFKTLTDQNLTRFINLAIFLDDNYISSSYHSRYYNTIVFDYRDTLIYDDQDVRNIVFIEGIKDTSHFMNEVVLFDRKDRLVLFSPYK